MSQPWSFYTLTPPDPDAGACDHETLSPEEDAAQEALYMGLTETLYTALNTYCATHEEITYETRLVAVNCVAAFLTKERDVEDADA